MSVRDNFWPKAVGPDPALQMQGYVDTICTVIMMVCAVIILASAARRWVMVLTGTVARARVVRGLMLAGLRAADCRSAAHFLGPVRRLVSVLRQVVEMWYRIPPPC